MAMRFRLMNSEHRDENGKTFVKGDIITTDIDLAASFGSVRFKRLKDAAKGAAVAAADDEDEFDDDDDLEDDEEDEFEEDDKATNPDGGVDVTSEFGVTDESLNVWKYDGGYFTITRDGDPLHPQKIRKTKVKQLLKEFQKKR